MNTKARLNRLEASARHCPKCAPRKIELVEVEASQINASQATGRTHCECGRPQPINRIEVVRPVL
jgi:hypothetical protein